MSLADPDINCMSRKAFSSIQKQVAGFLPCTLLRACEVIVGVTVGIACDAVEPKIVKVSEQGPVFERVHTVDEVQFLTEPQNQLLRPSPRGSQAKRGLPLSTSLKNLLILATFSLVGRKLAGH